ncbi:hypothetical protein JCM19233_5078 [Vibrio astriarenae]|nr:hypothetical protein JCM19233_5078 [Vibrio sp. C7]
MLPFELMPSKSAQYKDICQNELVSFCSSNIKTIGQFGKHLYRTSK